MKINWHENPLKTSIVLDDMEKKIFAEKAKVRELRSAAQYAALHLRDRGEKFYDPDRARSYLQHALDEDGVKERSSELLVELESGFHCGDCTCVATSCEKCLAEDILGVNTLDGLSQHGAHKLDVLYGLEGAVGIEKVLGALEVEIAEALETARTEEHAEAVKVYKWLLRYKTEKLGGIRPPS